uniref:Uncharacterized protein n=1 Tax=Rhizophora mucronata TaxID=61149 RepID=A0A2P2KGY8_RHIMU
MSIRSMQQHLMAAPKEQKVRDLFCTQRLNSRSPESQPELVGMV